MKMCPDKAGNVSKLAKKVNNIMCNKSGKVWVSNHNPWDMPTTNTKNNKKKKKIYIPL